jgi:methionyl-tRNA formyltransferase
MGTPAFAVPALRALVAAGHAVAAVYCQPPRPAGRGQRPRPSPMQAAAEALGLPVRHPESLRSAQAQAEFAALGAEAAVVVAYGLILPPAVLAAPAQGCLNIHASLLPRWRGAAPIHRALLAGDRETGVSIMRMDAGLDTGPVLLRRALPIGPEDTAGDLHDRLAVLGAALMVEALARLPGLVPEPQPPAGVTYAAKIGPGEGRVDWTRPAPEVDRLIRGLSPAPGAFCDAAGERLRLLRSRLAPGRGAPGQILAGRNHSGQPVAGRDHSGPPVAGRAGAGLIVACGEGAVELTEIQRPGGRALPAAEALRGWAPPPRLG